MEYVDTVYGSTLFAEPMILDLMQSGRRGAWD
jgi:hypothetical protein